MSLFCVNMAVPIKDSLKESQIYFLPICDDVPKESYSVDRKYLIFKTLELVTALCALMLFAYGMKATENEIGDMVKYVTLGVVTVYPLLFVLFSMSVKERPIFSIVSNSSAMIASFVIGATTISSTWNKTRHFIIETSKEKYEYSTTLMQLRSCFLLLVSGILYFVESLVMCFEIDKGVACHNSGYNTPVASRRWETGSTYAYKKIFNDKNRSNLHQLIDSKL